jgi:hypothetical protein
LTGDGEIEVRRKKIFYTVPTRAAKAGQKSLVRHDEPNELTKEGPLSYVLLESPFASVSTVGRYYEPMN